MPCGTKYRPPPGAGAAKELVSATLGEDPVRHSEDQPVELDDPGCGTIAHLSGDSLISALFVE
jgi:hypothetical protein